MLKSVAGIYRGGKIEFLEAVPDNADGKVIVTFLNPDSVVLPDKGIDEQQAAGLRQRLKAFVEDWDRPEMDVYDAV